MEHYNPEAHLNKNKRDFEEFIQKGDDFFKIELLRPAKKWYKKALELNIETDKVKHKIAECDRLLAFERKVVRILLLFASVLLIVYFIIYH